MSNVGKRRYAAFLDITPQDRNDVLRTDLSAAFHLARHAHRVAMVTRRLGHVAGAHLKPEGHLRRYRLCGQAGNPTPSIEHNLRRLFSRG